jgi:hypothetical protein
LKHPYVKLLKVSELAQAKNLSFKVDMNLKASSERGLSFRRKAVTT